MLNPGTQKSVMAHNFSQVPKAEIQRSSFNRSHGNKLTFNSGYLTPIFVDEVLPGDTFNLSANFFARLATPIVPIMDNLFLDTFYFFVPNRLLWSHWENFMGQQANPGDSISYLVPTVTCPTGAGGIPVGDLGDYFGLPTGVPGLTPNSLHFRAYNLIWNEWFRDQNLQNSVPVDTGDGPDTYTDFVLKRRGKRHDYFTSSLPWTQKGTAVTIPLGTTANVYGNETFAPSLWNVNNTNEYVYQLKQSGDPVAIQSDSHAGTTSNTGHMNLASKGSGYPATMYADLTNATASTINALRQAFQIQRLLERDARGGTRYIEIIKSHFGVTSPDARLQRPEYLGGGSQAIKINPIAQTGGTGASGTTTPQGNLAAMGTVSGKGNGFVKSFVEHGVLLGLCAVRADLNYQQGLNRMWSRQTRYDFYFPALSHLGEQAVLNQEIYCQGSANPTQDAAAFGYQERYAEYRYKPSTIVGQFRSTYSTPLDIWHLAQHFTSLPVLGDTFIQDNPPIQRVVAVESPYPEFLMDCYFQMTTARPMPTYSVPGLIDHF